MHKRLQLFTFLSEFKNTHATEIVNLNSIEEWIIEVDTGSTIDNHVHFFHNHLPITRANTKAFHDQIASYWKNYLIKSRSEAGLLGKNAFEYHAFKDLVYSLCNFLLLAGSGHQVDTTNIG
jgi:hypothetical protein